MQDNEIERRQRELFKRVINIRVNDVSDYISNPITDVPVNQIKVMKEVFNKEIEELLKEIESIKIDTKVFFNEVIKDKL